MVVRAAPMHEVVFMNLRMMGRAVLLKAAITAGGSSLVKCLAGLKSIDQPLFQPLISANQHNKICSHAHFWAGCRSIHQMAVAAALISLQALEQQPD
jgi:hypothetical protein